MLRHVLSVLAGPQCNPNDRTSDTEARIFRKARRVLLVNPQGRVSQANVWATGLPSDSSQYAECSCIWEVDF